MVIKWESLTYFVSGSMHGPRLNLHPKPHGISEIADAFGMGFMPRDGPGAGRGCFGAGTYPESSFLWLREILITVAN